MTITSMDEYLIYKTFAVFGFWNLIGTAFISYGTSVVISRYKSAIRKGVDSIEFRTRKRIKLLEVLVSIGIGYYLYTIISVPSIAQIDYYFGLTYLLFVTLLPIIRSLFILFRDRNDFILVTPDTIQYRNNREHGEFSMNDLYSAEPSSKDLRLLFKDQSEFFIKTSEMNLSMRDVMQVVVLIRLILEKKQSTY